MLDTHGDLVRNLMAVTGITDGLRKTLALVAERIKHDTGDDPTDFFSSVDLGSLVKEMSVVYRHFNEVELSELITFYQSALGRKAISLMPVITNEIMQISEKFVEKAMRDYERKASKSEAKES